MRTFSLKRCRFATAISMLSIVLAMTALMAGMTGCANRPAANAIEIRTWYDLAAIANNMSADYILENDLDATTDGYEELASPTANNGLGWKPITSQPEYFAGVFDGQGHTIRHLFINRTDGYRVGLFHYINVFGTIRNVGLVNATVIGGQRVGSLVGQVASAYVSNCNFTGTVTGSETVGGLVGGIWQNGIVSNCYAAGSVGGDSWVGGLVGYISEGTVTSSCCTGNVTGGGSVGGLVGRISQGTVTSSYCTGNVTGDGSVGGLVGGGGTVTNCHATGNVTGGSNVGGLVGYAENVTDSYATGCVIGSMQVGGLAGGGGNVTNCHATGYVTGTGSGAIGGLVGWHDEGTVRNCYATGNVAGNYSGGLVGVNGNTWLSFGPMALSYGDTVAIYYSYSTGSVTGSICVGGLVGENYLPSALVSNSYSTGRVSGSNNMTGGLVGFNAGNVSESYSTGSVAGNDCVGGLVGSNKWGNVTDSYSTGSVAGNYAVGGLVAYNLWGAVSNSFWDTQTSGQNTSAGGTGKNTTEMKDISTFLGVGWDIVHVASSSTRDTGYIWNIVDDLICPFLSWQPV